MRAERSSLLLESASLVPTLDVARLPAALGRKHRDNKASHTEMWAIARAESSMS